MPGNAEPRRDSRKHGRAGARPSGRANRFDVTARLRRDEARTLSCETHP